MTFIININVRKGEISGPSLLCSTAAAEPPQSPFCALTLSVIVVGKVDS